MTEQDAAFERCVDFLVRMMNKYGKEFLEDMEKKEILPSSTNRTKPRELLDFKIMIDKFVVFC